MKKQSALVFFSLLLLAGFRLQAQPGQWTWISGDSAGITFPVYGSMGVPSPQTTPGRYYEPMEWTDHQGKLWLMGSFSNDVWKFDPAIGQWTWMNDDPGFYGVQTVGTAITKPPLRGEGAVTWVDKNGNFWLFGGGASWQLGNDLWKYDPLAGTWTWMKGDTTYNSPGHYGVKGVASIYNNPMSRKESSCSWADSSGNLWMFGGQVVLGNNMSTLNDLWKYSIATNCWTWMGGDSTGQLPQNHGASGQSSVNYLPAAGQYYASWMDNADHLWMFGSSVGSGNEVWMYDIAAGAWTWYSGGTACFGSRCYKEGYHMPPARYETRARWTDPCGNLWMLGGCNLTNDLWKFDIQTHNWMFIGGDTLMCPRGRYGTRGVSAPGNWPGGRYGTVAWQTHDTLWLYGGVGYDADSVFNGMNDLWRYVPDTSCGWCKKTSSTAIDEPAAAQQVSVFPNPSGGSFSLTLNHFPPGKITLAVFDPQGQLVFRKELHHAAAEKPVPLSLPLAGGVYILSVTGGEQTVSRKLIITR